VIGAILSQAGATGRPVHAYGEMVALLWEAGDVVAAIALEEAWNELADEFAFALLCAYRADAVLGGEHEGALRQVCDLHSSVSGAPAPCVPHQPSAEVCTEFPADLLAPRSARHFVADALARWGLKQSVCDDAGLVVSELATNAVVHARSAFSVSVRAKGGRVRLSVSDASPVTPMMRDPTLVEASGRGLHLVTELAAQWGVESIAGAKTVWARLEA
jgi:anti-sigma regulatory factor (Ser/Thr protein kinase)